MRNLILCLISAASFACGDYAIAATTEPLTIVCYNIYHGANRANDDALTSQAEGIAAQSPDFVGLQEVDNRCKRSGNVDQMAELGRLIGMHRAFGAHMPYQGGEYGLGLLSRYPLSDVRTDRITLVNKDGTTDTRALLSATATLDGGTTVRLATVHMALNQESRLIQAREIIDYLQPDEQAVILTGDFNAEPQTEELRLLEEKFVMLNDPAAATFPVGEPVKTIDYIMISRSAGAAKKAFRVLTEVPHSDHYPLVATIELPASAD